MKINLTTKILAISSIVFVFILISVIFFSNLLVKKITSINDKVRQLQISSQERERSIDLNDTILDTESNRDKLTKYFLIAGDTETANFIGYLEKLADEADLVPSVKSVGYEAPNESISLETVLPIRFRFNVTGKWNNVFKYLQMIENLPKVTSVAAVSLDVNSGNWSADIDFSVAKLKN